MNVNTCRSVLVALCAFSASVSLLSSGCSKGDKSQSPARNCVDVVEGGWSFDLWASPGVPFAGWAVDLTQSSCNLQANAGSAFVGEMQGSYWEGTNFSANEVWKGNFLGTPADSFIGIASTLSGSHSLQLTGHHR